MKTEETVFIENFKTTATLAKKMAEKLGLPEDLCNKIYSTGLLLNIGKVTSKYQKDVDDTHHEIGWAYLTKKINDDEILNAIYWSHQQVENKDKVILKTSDDILSGLSKKDIQILNNYWEILKPSISTTIPTTEQDKIVEIPKFFFKDGAPFSRSHNAELLLIRACIISAESYLESKDPDVKDLDSIIDLMLKSYISGTPHKPDVYDTARYDLQKEIVKLALEHRTVQVNGPAGFGKTLVALLWLIAQKSKGFWICPRNIVAESVFDIVVKTIEDLGIKCSVELFFTSRRQKSYKADNLPEFSADIIITNLDSVMTPMARTDSSDKLFSIFGANVIFDEFHEFVSNQPLFATFVTYMRARHRISSTCKTLLISATPSLIHRLWDTTDIPTKVLPNKLEHYRPAHTGTYKIKFEEEFPKKAEPGSIVVCNSVTECQNNYTMAGYKHIIHHKYTENDHERRFNAIKKAFGKEDVENITKESLSSSLTVQASLDISCIKLYESTCGPESTMQRLGRLDRWGGYQRFSPEMIFVFPTSKSEEKAVETVYANKLSKLWKEFLILRLKGVESLDLNKFYKLYNEFNILYESEIINFLITKYKNALNGENDKEFLGLVGVSPFKYPEAKPDPDHIPKKAKRNLRCPNGTFFYSVERIDQPNVWLEPEDVMGDPGLYNSYLRDNELVNELTKTKSSSKMRRRIKALYKCGFDKWERQAKGKKGMPGGPAEWFRLARNPETPFPDFSKKYDPELGVIKNIKSK